MQSAEHTYVWIFLHKPISERVFLESTINPQFLVDRSNGFRSLHDFHQTLRHKACHARTRTHTRTHTHTHTHTDTQTNKSAVRWQQEMSRVQTCKSPVAR